MLCEPEGYRAYLVRLWEVHSGGKRVWRAALESVHSGERQAFTNLDGLFAYLEHQTAGSDRIEAKQSRPDDEEL